MDRNAEHQRTSHPATMYVRRLGVANQMGFAAGLGFSQPWLSHQLSGRRHFSDNLDFALRGFLLARGCPPEEVLEKINAVRRLAANSRNEAGGIREPRTQ